MGELGHYYREVVRDFKDTVYPFFESDTLFLEGVFVCCRLLLSDPSNRGMSKQYPLTAILESPKLNFRRGCDASLTSDVIAANRVTAGLNGVLI